jgi:2-(1,2-epoxy-1,2-dihydrophenyl)acetyl-CoA isomerase
VATATLARPEAGNSYDLLMARGIRGAAERIADGGRDGTIRAALITAEGSAFSVGGDLRYFADAADRAAAMRAVAADLHEALLCLTTAAVPVATAIHGAVGGGGIGQALAGDIVLASPEAKFRLAYTAAGLSPDCGASWILPRRIGLARALDLAMTSKVVTAPDAARWGMISRLVDGGDVIIYAKNLARTLAAGAGEALAETKRLLWSSTTTEFPAHLDREAATIVRLVEGAEGREGVDAFLAKRTPQFL